MKKTKKFLGFMIGCFMIIAFPIAALGVSEQEMWTQYKGTQIFFLSEDTPPTAAIMDVVGEFEKKTGIKVNITQTKLEDVDSKVLLDFAAHAGDIQVIYADPFAILAPLYGHFVDLRKFIEDPTLPQLPVGLDDFIHSQLMTAGYMIDKEKLLCIPYDAPTMIWIYRKDIFEKYHDAFYQEKGYDWTPGKNLSWEQYYEIAKWINDNVQEVDYGDGHQALQYDSLMCDFSNILQAYGGTYFENPDFATWGTAVPGRCLIDQPNAIEAAKFYKRLLSIAHPGSLSWDWNGVADAFAAGKIAMTPQWHEYAAMLEDPATSKVAGKVGYALLPHGPTGRSANLYGGTGIGINSYASEIEQKAAWLFIVWATSPEVQKQLLPYGSTPTRYSVYADPEVKKGIKEKSSPIMLTLNTVLEAWKPENVGMQQGKLTTWVPVDTTIFTNLSMMLTGRKTPEQAMKDAAKKIDDITGWSRLTK